MTEDRGKILSKAKKLKELAIRGVDGEMENAKVMLDSYMKKHSISEDELTGYTENPITDLSDMTDEEFMQQMFVEIIPVGIGALLSRFGNPELKNYSAEQSSKFLNKFLTEMMNRANKKQNKQ